MERNEVMSINTKFRGHDDEEEQDDDEEEQKEYKDKQDIQDELDMKRMMACGIVESIASSDFIKTQIGKNTIVVGNTMASIAVAAVNKIYEETK